MELPEGMEMVMPGDNVTIGVELITPVAMDKGLRFAIREGGRTVGRRDGDGDSAVTRETAAGTRWKANAGSGRTLRG